MADSLEAQESDGRPFSRLLRPRRDGPRRRTADKRDELAPLHVGSQLEGDGILAVQTSASIGAETGIKTTAAVHSQCRSWVISDRAIQRTSPGQCPLCTQ